MSSSVDGYKVTECGKGRGRQDRSGQPGRPLNPAGSWSVPNPGLAKRPKRSGRGQGTESGSPAPQIRSLLLTAAVLPWDVGPGRLIPWSGQKSSKRLRSPGAHSPPTEKRRPRAQPPAAEVSPTSRGSGTTFPSIPEEKRSCCPAPWGGSAGSNACTLNRIFRSPRKKLDPYPRPLVAEMSPYMHNT